MTSGRVVARVPASCEGVPGLRGIYCIRVLPTGKVYIGQAADFAQRWLEHQTHLAQGRHTNRRLQGAWDKHGPRAFTFEILEVVTAKGKAALTLAEQRWMDKFPDKYNVRPAGDDAWLERQAASKDPAVQARFLEAGWPPTKCTRFGVPAPVGGCSCFPCRLARGPKTPRR